MSSRQAVLVRSTAQPGRYVIEGDGKVFLSDSALIRQQPSIAPGPIELLVSALASCVLASVESDARDHGIALSGMSATVTSIRDETDETRFSSIDVAITVSGVTQDETPRLLEHLLGHCPIYNSLRRGSGGEVSVAIEAVP